MTDERGRGLSRRRYIQTAGLGAVSLAGVRSAAAAGGDEIWRFRTGDRVSSSPTVVNGTVYVGSRDRHMYALDAGDGTERWRFQTGDRVITSPTVVDGTVFFAPFKIYALDADDGTKLYSNNSIAPEASPTVVNGTVFVDSRIISALDADHGTEQWRFQTGGDGVNVPPTVIDGTVFVGADDNNVYALDAGDGTEQWRFQTGDMVRSSPTVAGGTVFVGSNDNNVYALDAGDGTEQWRFQTGNIVNSSPTVVDGTVFVAGFDSNLYALDTGDGTEQWRFQAGDGFNSSPTVADGTIFVGSNDNNVYALNASDGTEQWRFQTGGLIDSSPTVVNGTLFVGSQDNNIYALDAGVSGSSEGSRVLLGTLGHHGDWRYSGQSISINAPPKANTVEWYPSGPQVGETVTFNGKGNSDPDGTITTYEWSIDGTTYTGQTVEHTFQAAGTYTIELTVSDDGGATAMNSWEITVSTPATTETPTTTETPVTATLDQQQGANDGLTTTASEDSGGSGDIPILTQFGDSGTTLGLGLGALGVLGGGGYLAYRRTNGKGDDSPAKSAGAADSHAGSKAQENSREESDNQ